MNENESIGLFKANFIHSLSTENPQTQMKVTMYIALINWS